MVSWKVGNVRITRVVELEAQWPGTELLPSATPEALAKENDWLFPHFTDDSGQIKLSVHTLIVESQGKRLLVDTCIGNDKERKAFPQWDHLQLPFLKALEDAGSPRQSVDRVICTHLHVDHVGWNTRLVDGRWVPTFPQARYVFAATEVDYWRHTAYPADDPIFGDSIAPILDAGLAELTPVDHEVCQGVRLDFTPGHTPGHVSIVVECGGERAVITGDMIHTPLQIADVDLSSAFDFDRRAAAQTRREFLNRYRDDTLVIGTHWGGPGAGRVTADTDGRWAVEPTPSQLPSRPDEDAQRM